MQNMNSGVYKITNIITGDFYIGSSSNIKQRWSSHRKPSAQKHLPNSKLYKDMSQYGLDNFKFEVLEETADLKEREQYWIEQLKPSYNSKRAKREIEDFEEAHKQRSKAWYKSHRNEMLAYGKAYRQAHRDKDLANNNRLCFYENETLTLSALSSRFFRQGIPHAWAEALKYLL